MGAVVVIVAIVVLTAIIMLARKGRDQARRTGSKKTEYQKELSLTQTYMAITTSASVQQVKASINSHLNLSKGTKDDIKGDNYKILEDIDARITYLHNSTLNVLSDPADQFKARVGFKNTESGLRVTAHFLEWQEKKGVATQTALDAMQDFIDTVVGSVRTIDPSAQVETKPIPKKN